MILLLTAQLLVANFYARGDAAKPPSTALLRKTIQELKILPGDPFPSSCPAGYLQAKPDFPALPKGAVIPPELLRRWDCRSSAAKSGIPNFSLLRAGALIASAEMSFARLPGEVCTAAAIQEATGIPKDKLRFETDSAEKGASQLAAIYEFAPEITLTFTCSKVKGLVDGFSGELSTKYSELGTEGRPARGNIVTLAATGSFTSAPFFQGDGSTTEEMLSDTEARIKKFQAKANSLGPLAKKLFSDDISFAKSKERIAKVLKYAEETRQERVKKSADPALDQKKESDWMVQSPCHWKCIHDRWPTGQGSKCKVLQDSLKNLQNVKDRAAAARQMQSFFSSPEFLACNEETAQAQNGVRDLCKTACPGWFQEAAFAEVNKHLGWLKQFEEERKRSTGKYTTDISQARGALDAFAYKLGFVKPFGEKTPGMASENPLLMNTDAMLEQGLYLLPNEAGVRKTPFTSPAVLKLCPDCTATATNFKALAFADQNGDGKLDAWTIDQNGKIEHVQNGFSAPSASALAPLLPPISEKPVQLNVQGGVSLSLQFINSFPREVGKLVELRELMISQSVLPRIPDEVRNLKKLTKLEIAVLPGGVPSWIGELTELETLWLRIEYQSVGQAKAVLAELPESFGQLRKLKQLKISFLSVVEQEPLERRLELPASFAQLSALTDLGIGIDNKLRVKTVSDLVYSPPNIIYFSLGAKNISPAVANLKKAKRIRFVGAGIETLPAELGALPELTELDLRQCKLKSFPYQKGQFVKLAELLIGENELRDFPVAMISETPLSNLVLDTVCFPDETIKRLEEAKAKKLGFRTYYRQEPTYCKK